MSGMMPAWASSGSYMFIPNSYSYSNNQIYEGLGIKQVKCEFCLSEYYFSKDNTSCKNCGATYIEKNKY